MDFNYNTDAELQPQRSGLLSQVAQRLQENPQDLPELRKQVAIQVTGSPLSPQDEAEVAPTAAAAAAITVDKQRGLSPQQSIMQTLQEGNKRLADEKSKLYEAEATGKPLSRGQMVALAMLAMAPLIGRAVGGNMGGVAGGEGAMVAGKLMLGQEQGRQVREEKRIDAQAEAKDRQMLANDKAALEMQTLPLKAKMQQDAIYARHEKEAANGMGNRGTDVTVKVDTEGGKQIVKNQIEAEAGYKQTVTSADGILRTIDALQKSKELPASESMGEALWRDVKGKVIKGSAGDILKREQLGALIKNLKKQMTGAPSDFDTKMMQYVQGVDFGVPIQVIKYLAMRSKYLAYESAREQGTSGIVDVATGKPIQTTRLELGEPPVDPLQTSLRDEVDVLRQAGAGTKNPEFMERWKKENPDFFDGGGGNTMVDPARQNQAADALAKLRRGNTNGR